jgi:hypothetical protein
VVFSYCPAKQSVHDVLPATAKRPVAQPSHSEDPATSDFVLARQFVQSTLKVEPLFGFFFPAAHLLQSFKLETALAEEYVPDGHALQATMEV